MAKYNFQLPTSNFLISQSEGHVFSNPLCSWYALLSHYYSVRYAPVHYTSFAMHLVHYTFRVCETISFHHFGKSVTGDKHGQDKIPGMITDKRNDLETQSIRVTS